MSVAGSTQLQTPDMHDLVEAAEHASLLQGVPSGSVVPVHSPLAVQAAFWTHVLSVVHGKPTAALVSTQLPVVASQLETRHGPLGVQTFSVPTHSPLAHWVLIKHLSAREQAEPLGRGSFSHWPFEAHSPFSHAVRPVLQSLPLLSRH